MDNRLNALLGVDAYEMGIKQLKAARWGCDFTLDCVYNPNKKNQPFTIELKDCKKILWDVYVESFDAYQYDLEAIGLYSGKDNYEAPFNITTSMFDLSVFYRELSVIKDW